MTEERKYKADLAPAIHELKVLHQHICDYAKRRYSGSYASTTNLKKFMLAAPEETVISVIPGSRRRERGWYKTPQWERKSNDILEELELGGDKANYQEIFIAGEALSDSVEDIVLLMMHQVAHQVNMLPSNQSYHGEWFKRTMSGLFYIDPEDFSRDDVFGFGNSEKLRYDDLKHSPMARRLVKEFAKAVKQENIDIYRRKDGGVSKGTGKMRKWKCSGCKRPASIYTGAIIDITCNKCGYHVYYAHEDWEDQIRAGRLSLGQVLPELVIRKEVRTV